MSKQADYQRALELAKSGDLEQAQALLLTIDHPKAAALLEKVNKAIAARKAKQRPKASNKRPAMIVAILVLLVVGGVAFYYGYYLPSMAQAQTFTRQFAIQRICSDVYMDYYIDNDISAKGFVDACRQEAELAIIGMEEEIDYCLSQTQNGVLKVQMLQCLVDNGFKFSGVFIGAAE